MSSEVNPSSEPAELRLAARGLSKSYGAVRALNEVSFELRAGEVMALLGENGAGKSTLVKILAGLVEPDQGRIELDGQEATVFPAANSQRAGIAVVHQEFSSIRSMTVAENLALSERSSRRVWWGPSLARSARPMLQRVGLGHLDPYTRVERLSIPEQQLLEVARLLAQDAQVLIFDEPTASLSDAEIVRVMETIRTLVAERRSVVYVTHRLPEVFQLADRITIMRNGRSLAPITVTDATPSKVIAMMLGRELELMYPERPTAVSEEHVLTVEALEAPGLANPVSFDVRRGEILGLAGQLGSGSSAVVKALAGSTPIIGGRVILNGRTLKRLNRSSGIRAGLAYCSDDRKADGIFADKPIYQNLSSPWLASVSKLGWIARDRERVKAADSAGVFALDPSRLSSPARTFSGGNQQKVALAKWLGTDPVILLVEEPTRGVDVGARAEIYARLRQLCQQGTTIVVVSSDTAELHGLCDRVATFYRGELTDIRGSDEWTEQELIFEVMHSAQEAQL